MRQLTATLAIAAAAALALLAVQLFAAATMSVCKPPAPIIRPKARR